MSQFGQFNKLYSLNDGRQISQAWLGGRGGTFATTFEADSSKDPEINREENGWAVYKLIGIDDAHNFVVNG